MSVSDICASDIEDVECEGYWMSMPRKTSGTSAQSCGPEQLEPPECTGRQLGDALSVLGDKWETTGDKWQTHVKSCGQGIQGVFGRKICLEIDVKSCGPSMHPLQRSKQPSQVKRWKNDSLHKPGSKQLEASVIWLNPGEWFTRHISNAKIGNILIFLDYQYITQETTRFGGCSWPYAFFKHFKDMFCALTSLATLTAFCKWIIFAHFCDFFGGVLCLWKNYFGGAFSVLFSITQIKAERKKTQSSLEDPCPSRRVPSTPIDTGTG